MRQLPKTISLLAVSVFAVGSLAVVPVSAREGSDDSSTDSTVKAEDSSTSASPSSSSGRGSDDLSTQSRLKTEDSAKRVEIKPVAQAGETKDLKERAQKLLAEKRRDGKTKTLAERQKSCQARQAEVLKRSENYSRNAQRHLNNFNGIYDKVLAFQANKKLAAANFDQLKAAADAQKATAEAAVAALSGSDVTIDCTSSDPAAAVATLKTAVANARTALQDYRAAVKNIIVALQAAKNTASDTTKTEANQ